MLTEIGERDSERVLTLRIEEPTIGAEMIGEVESVLDDLAKLEVETLVFRFAGGCDSVTGAFPSWQPGPARSDMRYFGRWDQVLGRISRLRAKTLTAFDRRVGAAAVQVGFVTDLRLASSGALLSLGSLAEGDFPGIAAYWLPKFVGLGNARRILLLGEDLTAEGALQFGLIDFVDHTVDAAIDTAIKAARPVMPEAACFTRRLLDDSYVLEYAAATELAKAARYKVGMSAQDGSAPWRAGA